jgi:hypothetical protein
MTFDRKPCQPRSTRRQPRRAFRESSFSRRYSFLRGNVNDEFIFRLVSTKPLYRGREQVMLYAELEYTDSEESITIYHAASPFHFPMRETTRTCCYLSAIVIKRSPETLMTPFIFSQVLLNSVLVAWTIHINL